MTRFLSLIIVLPAFALAPGPTRAETINCISITSLPAVITTQGVYCLKQDLATAMTSGTAIEIAANNVTLDCNGRKLGGLAAGAGTQAVGIGSLMRSNVTVRNCNVRGFWIGISIGYDGNPDGGPSGNVVEHNRLELNTRMGIALAGDASVARGNTVLGTGGNTTGDNPIGLQASLGVDVIDNTIDQVFETEGSPTQAYGVLTWYNRGGTIEGNRIRGVQATIAGNGIYNTFASTDMTIRDNLLGTNYSASSYAITCISDQNLVIGNVAIDFVNPLQSGCNDGGGNVNNLAP